MPLSLSKANAFMAMAAEFSKLSTCPRRSVGCVLTDSSNVIIGSGYNGVPRGVEHCTTISCPGFAGEHGSTCWATHAEANALIQCGAPERVHNVFTTSFPCLECFKLILNSGAKNVYYSKPYPATEQQVYDLNLAAMNRIAFHIL